MEQKRPTTRTFLEEMIRRVQDDLKVSLEKREWEKCTTLQKQLDDLMAKREDMPTREDIQTSLHKAEDDLNRALAMKDFTRAATLQDTIDDLQKQLKDLPNDENDANIITEDDNDSDNNKHGFSSRTELECEISRLTKQIDTAVATKEFAKAASWQEKVVEFEKVRVLFPTVSELERSGEETSKSLERAITSKKFQEAENIQSTLNDLQQKLDLENRKQGETFTLDVSESTSVQETFGARVACSSQRFEHNEIISTSSDTPLKSVVVPKSPKNDVSKGRAVYKLRPKKPIAVEPHQSVLSVARTITSGRADAALIVLSEEGFAGVLTPHHITEKVVAQGIDPASISVSSVMKTKPRRCFG